MTLPGLALAVLDLDLPFNPLCSLAKGDNDYHIQDSYYSPGLEAEEGVSGNSTPHVGQLRLSDYRED